MSVTFLSVGANVLGLKLRRWLSVVGKALILGKSFRGGRQPAQPSSCSPGIGLRRRETA